MRFAAADVRVEPAWMGCWLGWEACAGACDEGLEAARLYVLTDSSSERFA